MAYTKTPTLDMKISNGLGTWTLAEAVADLKKRGLIGLLTNTPEHVSEEFYGFDQAVRDGRTPTIGGVLAAYWAATVEALEEAYYGRDEITSAQYHGRLRAAKKIVFRKS